MPLRDRRGLNNLGLSLEFRGLALYDTDESYLRRFIDRCSKRLPDDRYTELIYKLDIFFNGHITDRQLVQEVEHVFRDDAVLRVDLLRYLINDHLSAPIWEPPRHWTDDEDENKEERWRILAFRPEEGERGEEKKKREEEEEERERRISAELERLLG